MTRESERLHILAKITGYYGVKGWVKLYSYTEPKENIVHYSALKIKRGKKDEQWQDITLDNGKSHGKGVVAHFSGYDDRDSAADLIGAELAVYRSDFKAAAEDEYYWTDLLQLTVINLQGIELGRVIRMLETAANDVLVIESAAQNNGKNTEILIPFIQGNYVTEVDLDAGTILVDWPVHWNENETQQD